MSKNYLIFLFCAIFMINAIGKEIYYTSFEKGLDNWTALFNNRGGGLNGKVEISKDACEGTKAVWIQSSFNGSWTFLSKKLPAQDLPGKQVRVTVRIKTSLASHAFLVVSENFLWGSGQGNRVIATPSGKSDQWQEVSATLTRSNKNSYVGISLGMDFNSGKNWMLVDSIKIECADQLPPYTKAKDLSSKNVDVKIVGILLDQIERQCEIITALSAKPGPQREMALKCKKRLDEIKSIVKKDGVISPGEYKKIAKFIEECEKKKLTVTGISKVLETNDFSAGANGWKSVLLRRNESRLGEIDFVHGKRNYLWIYSPDQWSWSFIVKNFTPEQLQGKKVRLSCWMRSNRTKAILALAEGFEWGSSNGEIKRQQIPAAWKWERVVLEWTRKNPSQMISLAVGFDYTSDACFMEVANLKVECGDILPPLQTELAPGAELIDSRVLKCYEKSLKPLRQMVKYYEDKLDHISTDSAEKIRYAAEKIIGPASNKNQLSFSEVKKIDNFINKMSEWQFTSTFTNSLTKFDSKTFTGFENVNNYNLHIARNEKEDVVLLLRNNTQQVQNCQIFIEGPLAEHISMRSMLEVARTPDFVPLADNNTVIKTGSFETVGILFTVNSKDIAAGAYNIPIRVVPFDDKLPEKRLELKLKVYPVALPDEMPIKVFNWDYCWALDSAKLQFLIDSRVNLFLVTKLPVPGAFDFSSIEKAVKNLRQLMGERKFYLMFEVWFVRETNGWKSAYNSWLKEFVAATRKAGLNYKDWYFQIYDESLSDEFLQAAKKIMDIDSQIQLFSNLMPQDSSIIGKFAPYVKVWDPLARDVGNTNYKKAFQLMKKSGNEIWCYECDSNAQQPLAEYRLMPWLAWLYELDGIGFWTAQPAGFRGTKAGLTYSDSAGRIIPSRRWLQWQAGMDDYLLLHSASKKFRNNPAMLKLLKQAANEVLANRYSNQLGSILRKWRCRILAECSK
jgi:hypothetical protein